MAEVVDVFELTPMQGGMLFHTLMAPDSGTYFEQCWCVLDGPLDPQAFKVAWRSVVQRHEVLRSECHWVDLDRPMQVVYDDAEPEWYVADWADLDPAEQDQALSEWLHADRRRGFRLDKAPLLRFGLIRLGADRHRFIWSFHHLLMDGWCGSLLVRETMRLYAGLELPPAPPPYRRYVEWRYALDEDAARAYWSRTLAGLPDAGLFGLERGAEAPSDSVFEIRETLDKDMAARLTAMARRERLTLATVLQGAWAFLLSRYSGKDDIVFGTVLAGRPPELPGAETMVGLFLNTVPLRIDTSPDKKLLDWLQSLQAEHRQRERHGHAALSDIQRWSGAGAGQQLFDTLLIVENLPLSMQDAFTKEAGQLTLRDPGSFERTHYPLTLRIFPGEETVLALTVDRERLSPSDTRRWLRHYRNLLSSFADRSDARLGEIDILAPEERERLLAMGRGLETAPAVPVHEQVFAQAAEMPEKTALVYTDLAGDIALSYRNLADRVDALAGQLHARGAGRGAIVAVCLRRGPDLVCGLLAVMRAGATYLPIDPDYPAERITYMLQDSGTALVLTDLSPSARSSFPAGVEVMGLDEQEVSVSSKTFVPVRVHAEDLAYILYTSGSTGLPKGVPIRHGALSNFIQAMAARPGIDANDRLLALTTIGFDIAGLELFGPLAAGGTVILSDGAVTRDGARLVSLVVRVQPTLIQATPAGWRMFVEAGWKGSPSIRMLCGGEALDARLAVVLLARGQELWNLYGPTETTIWSAVTRVQHEMLSGGGVPVAGPIDRTQLYVLDPRGEPVSVGVPGELYIGGAGLSPGYWGKVGLTAEKFIPNSFRANADDGLYLYRTGDLVRWREDGMLDFLGRIDNQLKLRGYRIEPGEIEARLAAHPMVDEAAVLIEDRGTDRQLVAYLRMHENVQDDGAVIVLQDHLAQALPSYMVPTVYVPLERFPLTPNGKVDRRALPSMRSHVVTKKEEPLPVFGEPASTLAGIWREALQVESVGLKDNFFDLGGHSLLVITLQSVVRERLGLVLDITDFFRFPTLETMAARISALTGHSANAVDEHPGRSGSRIAGRERLAQRRGLRGQQTVA